MKTTKAKKQNPLMSILKGPGRVLKKITIFYMNSMTSCAGRFGETTVVTVGLAPQVSHLPRNFSVSSSKDGGKQEEELRDLIRAVSTKLSEGKIDIKNINDPHDQLGAGLTRMKKLQPSTAAEKRSYSVGIGRIGRIDEEMPCDFKEASVESNFPNGLHAAYPRCKSYAVTATRSSNSLVC